MATTYLCRGEQVESFHQAWAVALTRDGRRRVWGAHPDSTSAGVGSTFLRSVAKPFQTLALYRAGVVDAFSLTPEEIAVITSSHAGEAYHHRLVANILARGGFDETQLGCGVHPPFARSERHRRMRAGEPFSVLGNNCSGKHAGMLLHALQAKGDPERYLHADHPVQVAIRELLQEFCGVSLADPSLLGTDGCGAPTYHLSLATMAQAFLRLDDDEFLRGHDLSVAGTQLRQALHQHPRARSGEGRFPFEWSSFLGELLSKEGAEGVFAVWGPAGTLLTKSLDGHERGYRWLIPTLLEQLGWISEDTLRTWRAADPAVVKNVAGAVVGEVRVDATRFFEEPAILQ